MFFEILENYKDKDKSHQQPDNSEKNQCECLDLFLSRLFSVFCVGNRKFDYVNFLSLNKYTIILFFSCIPYAVFYIPLTVL